MYTIYKNWQKKLLLIPKLKMTVWAKSILLYASDVTVIRTIWSRTANVDKD